MHSVTDLRYGVSPSYKQGLYGEIRYKDQCATLQGVQGGTHYLLYNYSITVVAFYFIFVNNLS